MELDEVLDAEAAVEVQEVDAAAEQDVLAVVDGLLAGGKRQGVRRSTAAEKLASFEYGDAVTGGSQGSRGCQPGESAAEHEHIAHQPATGRRARLPPPPEESTFKASQAQMIRKST
jgi:hypothetical protein